jgi:hypothetical protein
MVVCGRDRIRGATGLGYVSIPITGAEECQHVSVVGLRGPTRSDLDGSFRGVSAGHKVVSCILLPVGSDDFD